MWRHSLIVLSPRHTPVLFETQNQQAQGFEPLLRKALAEPEGMYALAAFFNGSVVLQQTLELIRWRLSAANLASVLHTSTCCTSCSDGF